MDKPYDVRPVGPEDRDRVREILRRHWGSPRVVTRGRVHRAERLPGFVARDGEGTILGLLTCSLDAGECEIVSLNSEREGIGVGTALLEAALRAARAAGCRRAWLITTNDNLPAIRFYQKRGWTLRAVYPDAIARSRRLKPEIPETGVEGIPIRDEIELDLSLAPE